MTAPTLRRSLVFAALAFGALALAQDKGERKGAKDADLAKKAATTVDKSLAGDIRRKVEDRGPDAPTLQYDTFRSNIELQVRDKRLEQIAQLKKLLALSPDTEKERPALLFRLAELYWEESKYFFLEAGKTDDDYIRAMNKKDKAGMDKARAAKAEREREAQKYGETAKEAYAEIATKHRNYERSDEVLYFLGQTYLDSKDEKDQRKALLAFDRLINKHKKSKFVPDAHLSYGEYYFNKSKTKADLAMITKALESYKAAAADPTTQVYAYALYKQGWCYFLLNDFHKAMDLFKAVVLYAELQGEQNIEREGAKKGGKATLAKEARNDYVRAFERVGSPQEARQDFGKLAKDEERFGMMRSLANLYYSSGKDKEAAVTFNMLIKEKPLSPEAPGFQAKIVDCILRAGNKKMTVQQVRKLVDVINEVEKAKVLKEEKDFQALKEAKDLSERTISNLAVNWHAEARKTRDDETFALANDVYSDYLTLFPDSPKAYDLRFFWAELLFDNLQRFDKAADEYGKVMAVDVAKLEAKPPQKPGVRLVTAAYNSILAWDEVVKKAEEAGQLKADTTDLAKKAAIPAPKQGLLDACERYLKHVPGSDKKVEIAFKAANIFYRYNHFEEAVARFADIALKSPDHKFEDGQRASEIAANLVLDSFNLQGDWSKVNEWARKFYANERLAAGKFREDLSKVIEQSAFKLVNQMEAKKDYARAAEAYLTFVSEFPRSEIADKALFNASIDYFQAKMLDRAIKVRERIISQYPRSEHVPACVFANAEAHEAIGDFELAAEAYERYVRGYEQSRNQKDQGRAAARRPARARKGKAGRDDGKADKPLPVQKWEEPKAQIALFNAGVFREGLGQLRQALKAREKYLELWPKSKDQEAVFLSIADLYEKMGSHGKALGHLEQYERDYAKDPNKVLLAEARIARIFEEKARRPREVQRILTRVQKYYEQLGPRARKTLEPGAVEVAARAHLLSVEPDYQFYTSSKLRWGTRGAMEKEFKATLEEKGRRLKVVLENYTKTVKYNAGDTGICALHKIGLAYQNFAETLVNAPMPRGSNQELQDAIRDEMTKQAAAPKEKAAEAFAAAVAKARELDINNDCARKSLERLREEYRPDQYPPLYEKFLDLKEVKQPQLGGDLLASIQPVPALNEAQQRDQKEKARELQEDLKDLTVRNTPPPDEDEPPPGERPGPATATPKAEDTEPGEPEDVL